MNWGIFAALLIVLVIFYIGIVPMTLLLHVMFPHFIRRARNNAERMPIRSALVGTINFIFFTALTLAILGIAQEADDGGGGLLRVIAILIVLILAAFFAFGIAVIARWVGERLLPEASVMRQNIGGIVILELATLAPLVGWFVLPLVVMLVGYGAVIIALVWKREM